MGCNRKLKLLVSQLFRGLEERFKISFAADSASDHGSVNCLYLHFLPTAAANAGICFKSVVCVNKPQSGSRDMSCNGPPCNWLRAF